MKTTDRRRSSRSRDFRCNVASFGDRFPQTFGLFVNSTYNATDDYGFITDLILVDDQLTVTNGDDLVTQLAIAGWVLFFVSLILNCCAAWKLCRKSHHEDTSTLLATDQHANAHV